MQKTTHTHLLNLKAAEKVQRIPAGDSLFLHLFAKRKRSGNKIQSVADAWRDLRTVFCLAALSGQGFSVEGTVFFIT